MTLGGALDPGERDVSAPLLVLAEWPPAFGFDRGSTSGAADWISPPRRFAGGGRTLPPQRRNTHTNLRHTTSAFFQELARSSA